MRKTEKRYLDVDLTGKIETIEGPARLKIHTNFPVKTLRLIEGGGLGGMIEFLSKVIVEWDGFDMPLSAESLEELTADELKEMTSAIMDALNPPNGSSATS